MYIIRESSEIKTVRYADFAKSTVIVNEETGIFYSVDNILIKKWISNGNEILLPERENLLLELINSLEIYYNSENFRKTEIEINNNSYVIINTSKLRNLFLRKILIAN